MNELNEALYRHLRGQFPKTCTCCQRQYDGQAWEALHYRGWQGDQIEELELRDCVCGSTLAIVSVVRNVHVKVHEILGARFGGVL